MRSPRRTARSSSSRRLRSARKNRTETRRAQGHATARAPRTAIARHASVAAASSRRPWSTSRSKRSLSSSSPRRPASSPPESSLAGRREALAQARDVDLQRLRCGLRWRRATAHRQSIGRDRLVRVQQQDREQRALLAEWQAIARPPSATWSSPSSGSCTTSRSYHRPERHTNRSRFTDLQPRVTGATPARRPCSHGPQPAATKGGSDDRLPHHAQELATVTSVAGRSEGAGEPKNEGPFTRTSAPESQANPSQASRRTNRRSRRPRDVDPVVVPAATASTGQTAASASPPVSASPLRAPARWR